MFGLYDKEAYELLKKCSYKRDMSEWNEYREKTGNQKVNLRFANLEKFYLRNANIQNIDFRFCDLSGVDMIGSDVHNSIITTYMSYLELFLYCLLLNTIIDLLIFMIVQDLKITSFIISFVAMSAFVTIDSQNKITQGAIAYIATTTILVTSLALATTATAGAASVVHSIVAAFIFSMIIAFSMLTVLKAKSFYFVLISIFVILLIFFHLISDYIPATAKGIMVALAIIYIVFLVIAAIKAGVDEVKTNLHVVLRAKNPEMAIGFNPEYKQTDISAVIEEFERKAQGITDEEKRNEILQKIESLKQQKTIEKAIESLKKPYKYLEDEIKKLRIHNYFFYALIAGSFFAAFWYGINEYQNRDSYIGVLFGDVKSVDFGSILGISLFYGTPIVFLTFLIIYAVSQINKNIDKVHELLTQKNYIEILASAFNSKTEAGATDEEIQKDLKMAADAIRDATIAKMLGKEKKEEDKESTKKDRYREIADAKAAFALFSTMLKNSK